MAFNKITQIHFHVVQSLVKDREKWRSLRPYMLTKPSWMLSVRNWTGREKKSETKQQDHHDFRLLRVGTPGLLKTMWIELKSLNKHKTILTALRIT